MQDQIIMTRCRRNNHLCAGGDGYTLLELLVVLAILGLLIGLVAPAVIRQLGSAKHQIAGQAIQRLGTILDTYRLDTGIYPTTEQGLSALATQPPDLTNWNGPYVKDPSSLKDPWGRIYLYRNPGQREGHDYDLCTLGSDGKEGGTGEAADICNP